MFLPLCVTGAALPQLPPEGGDSSLMEGAWEGPVGDGSCSLSPLVQIRATVTARMPPASFAASMTMPMETATVCASVLFIRKSGI